MLNMHKQRKIRALKKINKNTSENVRYETFYWKPHKTNNCVSRVGVSIPIKINSQRFSCLAELKLTKSFG